MLILRNSMLGEAVNEDLIKRHSGIYASLYAEYEDRLATEASIGSFDIDDCSTKLA